MSSPSARSGEFSGEELPQSLTDRVLARVVDARSAVDLREHASRPKSKRRRGVAQPVSGQPDPQELREFESLKRVFRDLGVTYREYRRQTGEPVAPAVREAANKFKAAPTLTSLVSVAGALDELEILSW